MTFHLRTTSLAVGALIALSMALPLYAGADSTPIGPLPTGPVTVIAAPKGTRVAIAVPRPAATSDRVWRIARAVDPTVLRQVSETNVGKDLVIVFRAVARGEVSVVLAQTRGDAAGTAVRAATFRIRVT